MEQKAWRFTKLGGLVLLFYMLWALYLAPAFEPELAIATNAIISVSAAVFVVALFAGFGCSLVALLKNGTLGKQGRWAFIICTVVVLMIGAATSSAIKRQRFMKRFGYDPDKLLPSQREYFEELDALRAKWAEQSPADAEDDRATK